MVVFTKSRQWRTKSLSEGLLNKDWNTFTIEHNRVKEDNRFTFHLSDDMPKQVKRFVTKTIRKIDKVTEFKIARTRREDIADVFVYDVDNYDNFGPDYAYAKGVAFLDPTDDFQLNATWLTSNYIDTWTNRKGKVRLGKITKHIIVHGCYILLDCLTHLVKVTLRLLMLTL